MNKALVPLLFTLVSLTWGTTWLAMKIAVETIPPIFATGMRFLFSAPILVGIAWITKTPLLFPAGQRFFQLIICLFYFAIPFTLMIYGEIYVSSSLAAIIFSTMPAAVLISSVFILNEKTSQAQIVGLIIATLSLVNILVSESGTAMAIEGHGWGFFALISAVSIHAIIYVQCKKRCCHVSVITFNALPCFVAGLLLVSCGLFFEAPHITIFSSHSIWSTFYLGAFAGVFGILCYFSLQQKVSSFKASLVFLIFPLIAIVLESHVYDYDLSSLSKMLMIPLVAGIFFTLTPKKDSTTEN